MLRVASYARNFGRKKFRVKLLGCLLSFVDLLQSYQMEKSITSREEHFPSFAVARLSNFYDLESRYIRYQLRKLSFTYLYIRRLRINRISIFTYHNYFNFFDFFAKLASGIRQLSIYVCCLHFKVLN